VNFRQKERLESGIRFVGSEDVIYVNWPMLLVIRTVRKMHNNDVKVDAMRRDVGLCKSRIHDRRDFRLVP